MKTGRIGAPVFVPFFTEEINMNIRRAKIEDIQSVSRLLNQVLTVHHNGRPDLFKGNCRKYTDSELEKIIVNDETPVFVAEEGERILGYAFCAFLCHENHNIFTNIKTLYIDDLCVDEKIRGKHVGTALYEHVLSFAKENNCYNVTLNVWSCNEQAMKFYEKCGLVPYKVGMEKIL